MQLEELHDKLFDVLCTIDDICRRENVRYFLDSGTELGSVREKDFIPWDDDVDLKVMMEDYPKFKETMIRCLPEYMHFLEPEEFAPGFRDVVVRIYDDRYLLREETDEDRYYRNYENHVGTDVFIICKSPEQHFLRKLMEFRLKFIYALGMSHRYVIKDEKFNLTTKIEAGIMSLIGKPFHASWICRRYFALMESYDRRYRNSTNCIYANFPSSKKSFPKNLPYRIYQRTAEGTIRGRKFPIPFGYDEELTTFYGDYMKPPKDVRSFEQHIDLGELEKAYKDNNL